MKHKLNEFYLYNIDIKQNSYFESHIDQPKGLMIYRLRGQFFQNAHHRQMQWVCAAAEDAPAVTQQGFQQAWLAHDLPVPLRFHQSLHMMGHS